MKLKMVTRVGRAGGVSKRGGVWAVSRSGVRSATGRVPPAARLLPSLKVIERILAVARWRAVVAAAAVLSPIHRDQFNSITASSK